MKWLKKGWPWSALLTFLFLAPISSGADRVIRIEGTTLAPGQAGRVLLILESLGDEKALGFNIAYDPDVLTFVSAQPGAGAIAANAGLTLNPNQTTNFGRLGLALATDLFSTNTFLAGTNVIAEVFFTPVAGLTGGVSAITFTNEPSVTEISDRDANSLPAFYFGGSVTVELNCSFALATNAASFTEGSGFGSVNLFATNQLCEWAIENTNSWITITSATNGAGNATVNFSVDGNPLPSARSGVILIAGHVFTITQQGIVCTYAVAPSGRAHGGLAETNTFDVTTLNGCAWSVDNTNAWVTILSGTNGSGNGTVTYAVAQFLSASTRAGTLTVNGQTFAITQQGIVCTYEIVPSIQTLTAAASTNAFDVNTTHPCPWEVNNPHPWITILSSGGGQVTYAVTENLSISPRSGALDIAGQTFTINQQAIPCAYELSSTNGSHGPAMETNSFHIITTNICPWSVDNTNAWIAILSGSNGVGNGAIDYTVAANLLPSERSGTLVIAGQAFSVTQQGSPCAYELSSLSGVHGSAAATNTFSVVNTNACPWFVDNTNTWITILSGSNGAGSGVVTYSVHANETLAERTGEILVAGAVFSVTQQAAVCSFALTSTSAVHGPAAATNSFNINTLAACAWSVANTNPWIEILAGSNGLGNGTITYALSANPVSLARTGTLVIEGQTFVVTQQGISCTYSISPTRRTHGFGAASNFFTVNTGPGCLWTAINTNPWISVVTPSGNGSTPVGYLVEPNASPSERVGFITVETATLIITQRSSTCTYTVLPGALGFSSGGGTGAVSITTGAGCVWNATTTNHWISFATASNGTANGSFDIAVAMNWNSTPRTGAVAVAGQTIPVTQAAYTGGFVFRSINMSVPGEISLSLTGGPLGVWELQVSDDLSAWSKLADLTNATGRVDYLNPSVPTSNRFYRAIQP